MCGRFHVSTSPSEIARAFGVKGPVPNFGPRYNAAPTQTLPVIRWNPETRERSLDLLRWGLIPFWAKDEKIGYTTINARADGIETKPAFREALKKRRCLVPADGFFEWKKIDAKTKQPYCIRLKGGGLFAFAGLWEGWKPAGSEEWLRTFTVVTTTPNDLCAAVHDRMPVILDPTDYGKWLGEDEGEPGARLELLRPFPTERMEAFPIGSAVGNVKNDRPGLIEPLALN